MGAMKNTPHTGAETTAMTRHEIIDYIRYVDAEMDRPPTPDVEIDEAIGRLADEAGRHGDHSMATDCLAALGFPADA